MKANTATARIVDGVRQQVIDIDEHGQAQHDPCPPKIAPEKPQRDEPRHQEVQNDMQLGAQRKTRCYLLTGPVNQHRKQPYEQCEGNDPCGLHHVRGSQPASPYTGRLASRGKGDGSDTYAQ